MKPSATKIWPMVSLFLLIGLALGLPNARAALYGQVSETNKHAWSETSGWQDFMPAYGGVTIHTDHLSGYAWSANVGWIKLGAAGEGPYANTTAANWGVNRDPATGNLSGYAWSETVGWITFQSGRNQVTIDSATGGFTGYAWNGNIGYIHFQNTAPAYKVQAITIPGAPTIGLATAASRQTTVSFTPPAWDGGSPITEYTVTADPGGLTGSGAGSPITVAGLTNGVAYTFTVTATNDIGPGPASGPSNSVIPSFDPPQVSGTASPTNIKRPTWSWTPGAHGGSGTYRFKRNSANLTSEATITTGTNYTPTSDLVQGTHTLYVQEQDAFGNWSTSGRFAIVIDTTRPADPQVTGVTPTNQRKPSWSWTSGGNGGSGNYRYKRNSNNLTTGATLTTATSYTPDTNLKPGTYTLYVQERDAAGNWSATGSFAIFIDITPPAPPQVTGVTPTNQSKPSWTWTSGGNGGSGNYRFKRNSSNLTLGATLTTATNYTPGYNLAQGIQTLYVQERDAVGNWSAAGRFDIVIDTALLPPLAPTNVAAVYSSSVSLSWTDVATNEAGYSIYRKLSSDPAYTKIGETGPNLEAYEDTTAVANATYTYYIAAFNGAGASNSTPITISTGGINAPDQTVATVANAGLQVDLAWRDNSGSEDNNRVLRKQQGENDWTTVANLGPNIQAYSDTGLTPRVMYTYIVCATGLGGANECGDPVTVNGPTTVSAVKRVTGIYLTWQDNADDESGFRVYRRKSTEVASIQIGDVLGPDTVAFTDTTAVADTTYLYTVEAFTSVGSALSPNEDRITTGTIIVPGSFQAVVVPGGTQATLTWADKSGTENGFAIWRRMQGDPEWTMVQTTAADATTTTDSDLTVGTLYSYQVCAVTPDPEGGSDHSACSLADGVNGPTNLQAVSPAAANVDLTWWDNAGDETGFVVYRRLSTETAMTAMATMNGDSTAYTDSTAAGGGTTYYYQVCAFNSVAVSCSLPKKVIVP